MSEGQPAHYVTAYSPVVAAGHLAGASGLLAEESQHLRGAFQPQDSTHLWPVQSPGELREHRSSGLLKSMCRAYPFSHIVRSHRAGCRTSTSESEQKTIVSLYVAENWAIGGMQLRKIARKKSPLTVSVCVLIYSMRCSERLKTQKEEGVIDHLLCNCHRLCRYVWEDSSQSC
jgi:hypothetical protein